LTNGAQAELGRKMLRSQAQLGNEYQGWQQY
jgi:hypothetical protein